jgi:hypothetical protein
MCDSPSVKAVLMANAQATANLYRNIVHATLKMMSITERKQERM